MDKQLQRKILEIIKAQGGEVGFPVLRQKIVRGYWKVEEPTDEQQKSFLHQLRLLETDGKLQKDMRTANVFYVITSPGYLDLSSWYKRFGHFLLYDKNNIYVILPIVVSIISLIVSLSK